MRPLQVVELLQLIMRCRQHLLQRTISEAQISLAQNTRLVTYAQLTLVQDLNAAVKLSFSTLLCALQNLLIIESSPKR